MLNVLIVDDDIIARTNLKTLINWNECGFEIGEASNGSDAVSDLERNNYHIVITDMSMPNMDGLALIEHLEKNYPAIKVIALSGYNDFDYVSQSLKKGAIDYILKHKLDANGLLAALHEARKAFLSELQTTMERQKQLEQLHQSRTVLVQRFIKKLANGQVTDKNTILENLETLNINIGLKNLIVISAEIDGFLLLKGQNLEVLIQSFLNISEEVLKELNGSVIIYMENGRFMIIACLGENYSYLFIHNQLIEIIGRIKSSLKRYLGVTVSFGISNVCNSIQNISKYFREAEKALNSKFYIGKDHILWSGQEAGLKENFITLDIKDENNIVENLKKANLGEVMKNLEEIFSRAVNSNASYKSVQVICAELYNIANKTAKEFGIEDPLISSGSETPYEILNKFDTIQDTKQWMMNTMEKYTALIEATRVNQDFSGHTKKAIEFINKNYGKAISLTEAAEYAGVSVQYLSTVFKEDCGMVFTDYLNNVRVNRAKNLILNSSDKLKDIIPAVGFNNYNYFFKVFKKITGITPDEYKKVNNL